MYVRSHGFSSGSRGWSCTVGLPHNQRLPVDFRTSSISGCSQRECVPLRVSEAVSEAPRADRPPSHSHGPAVPNTPVCLGACRVLCLLAFPALLAVNATAGFNDDHHRTEGGKVVSQVARIVSMKSGLCFLLIPVGGGKQLKSNPV